MHCNGVQNNNAPKNLINEVDLPSGKQSTAISLELDYQVCDPQVSLLLKVGEHTSAEEDLGLSNSEEAWVQLQCFDHLLASLLSIHEALGDDVGSEELVALTELLEGNPVGESLSANSDSLEHTIAPGKVAWSASK